MESHNVGFKSYFYHYLADLGQVSSSFSVSVSPVLNLGTETYNTSVVLSPVNNFVLLYYEIRKERGAKAERKEF